MEARLKKKKKEANDCVSVVLTPAHGEPESLAKIPVPQTWHWSNQEATD